MTAQDSSARRAPVSPVWLVLGGILAPIDWRLVFLISVPVGFDDRGLPMGMQLIGPPRADIAVLQLAHSYEGTINELGVGDA